MKARDPMYQYHSGSVRASNHQGGNGASSQGYPGAHGTHRKTMDKKTQKLVEASVPRRKTLSEANVEKPYGG